MNDISITVNNPAPPSWEEMADEELNRAAERVREELRRRERARERAMDTLGKPPAGWFSDGQGSARQVWRRWKGAGGLSYYINVYLGAGSGEAGRVVQLPSVSFTATDSEGNELRLAQLAGWAALAQHVWPVEGRTLAEVCAWADQLALDHMRAEVELAEKKMLGEG